MSLFINLFKALIYICSVGQVNMFKKKSKLGGRGLPTEIMYAQLSPTTFTTRKDFVKQIDKVMDGYGDEVVTMITEDVPWQAVVDWRWSKPKTSEPSATPASMSGEEMADQVSGRNRHNIQFLCSALLYQMLEARPEFEIGGHNITDEVYGWVKRDKEKKATNAALGKAIGQGDVNPVCPDCGANVLEVGVNSEGDCNLCSEPIIDLDEFTELFDPEEFKKAS
jgi:hypothetical protein